MEASLISNGITCYHKTLTQTITKDETQDCVIPDTLPDIGEIIAGCGNILIRSKEVNAGRIRVECNIPVKVSCCAELDGNIYGLALNIPVYFSVEDPQIHEDSFCTTELKLIGLDCKILNSRKISVTAKAELKLTCFEKKEIESKTVAPEGIRDIHIKEQSFELSSIVDVKEKTFVLMDEYILPAGKTPIAEILGYQLSFTLEDQRILGTKVILKGKAKSILQYRSDEMKMDAAEFVTEFSQIIDVEYADENSYVATLLLLSGLYFDAAPGFDGRTVKMELHAAAQVQVCSMQKISCVADAYSNLYEAEMRFHNSQIELIHRELILRAALHDVVELPYKPVNVVACRVHPLEFAELASGLSSKVLLSIYYCTDDGKLIVAERTTTVNFSADLQTGEKLRFCDISIVDANAMASAGGAECHIQLEARCFAVEQQEINSVCAISYDETKPRDLSRSASLVIMKAEAGADLWTIARENCSTTEAICMVNSLETVEIHEEKLLLIPKTV